MASLLTSEIHSIDGVVKYIAECRSHSINVLPPDINESNKEFTVTGSKIRFGLVAVKNVGEGAIESIIEARKEKIGKEGRFTSLFNFCERVGFQKVNKRVVESLIKCGAFDSTGDKRSRMMASLEDALDYGQRVQREMADPQIGLFDTGEIKQTADYPPMPEIDEWDEKQLLAFEKEFLGFYITGHPLTSREDVLEKFTNADSISLKEKKDGETIRIGGIVRNVKTIKTKKGDLMAFVTIEDLLGSVEVTIFSSVYASVHNDLSGDSPVLVQGRIQKDENSVKILVDTLIPLDKAEEKLTASIHFNLNMTRTNKELLLKLYDILKKHPGLCLAHIHLCEPAKTEILIALPDTIKVKAGPALTREVNELFGYNVVETVCTQIPVYSKANNFKKKRQQFTA